MKTEPTAIDREAATLFAPAPGMRVHAWGRWVRVATDDYGLRECDEVVTDAHSSVGVDALDTDDPATVGCMLAQVRERVGSIWLQPLWRVSIPADAPYHGETMATVTGRVWSVMTSTGSAGDGPTEGAALVSAMRAIKGAK